MNYYPFTVHVYVNLCIVCIEPSIIQFEKEVEYDNDDEGDDEVWHSETYQVESGGGENPSDPDNYSWCHEFRNREIRTESTVGYTTFKLIITLF